MAIEAFPFLLEYPLVLSLIYAVLLKSLLIAGVPYMHSFTDVKFFFIRLAIRSRKPCGVCFAIEIPCFWSGSIHQDNETLVTEDSMRQLQV